MSVEEVLDRVSAFGCHLVEVTGGEPLIQPTAALLLKRLCEAGYETLLETNGSLDISQVDPRVVRIVDFKCPSSGEVQQNLWSNVEALSDRDEVKFVLADRPDYQFARQAVIDHSLCDKCTVLFSPAAGHLEAARLTEWILADKLDVRLNLQLHKIIWCDKDCGV